MGSGDRRRAPRRALFAAAGMRLWLFRARELRVDALVHAANSPANDAGQRSQHFVCRRAHCTFEHLEICAPHFVNDGRRGCSRCRRTRPRIEQSELADRIVRAKFCHDLMARLALQQDVYVAAFNDKKARSIFSLPEYCVAGFERVNFANPNDFKGLVFGERRQQRNFIECANGFELVTHGCLVQRAGDLSD